MNKKSKTTFYVFVSLFSLVFVELLYLSYAKTLSKDSLDKKIDFIKLAQLPDLAISTESSYIRHRSLSTIGSIYKDDGSLREYFPSTFAISPSHTINKENQ